eukprot:GHVR01133385.1.p1 GENE.GHVR01133385.1~~GHVR01133385.1.p1  ORF type:complete len:180 (+),score=40.38 GHVR01133385.1:17-556(+)
MKCGVLLCLVSTVGGRTEENNFRPVFIVPGTGGTRLDAEYTLKSCGGVKSKNEIWIGVPSFLSSQQCWIDRLSLKYDYNKNTYVEKKEVKLVPFNNGSFDEIRYLTNNQFVSHYFSKFWIIIDKLLDMGHIEGETLFGIPFDWRRGWSAFPKDDIKRMISSAVSNTGRKAIVIAHSFEE